MPLHVDVTAASRPIADSSAFNFALARADSLGDYWVSGGRQIEAIRTDVPLHRKHLDLF